MNNILNLNEKYNSSNDNLETLRRLYVSASVLEKRIQKLLNEFLENQGKSYEKPWQSAAARQTSLRTDTLIAPLGHLYRIHNLYQRGLSKEELYKLAEKVNIETSFTFCSLWPHISQGHLQQILNKPKNADEKKKGSLESTRQLILNLHDIGLLDREEIRNGKTKYVTYQPNLILAEIYTEFLETLGGTTA